VLVTFLVGSAVAVPENPAPYAVLAFTAPQQTLLSHRAVIADFVNEGPDLWLALVLVVEEVILAVRHSLTESVFHPGVIIPDGFA